VIHIEAYFIPLCNFCCLSYRRHTTLQAQCNIRRLYATYVNQMKYSTLQPLHIGYNLTPLLGYLRIVHVYNIYYCIETDAILLILKFYYLPRLLETELFIIITCEHLNFVINPLNAQNHFYNKFIICLYMFRALRACHQEVKIVLYSSWYYRTFRWPSGAQVERGLCTGRPPIHRCCIIKF
jgi:hypothetical protein